MKITEEHIKAIEETIVDYTPPYIKQKTKRWHSISSCAICQVAQRNDKDSCELCLYHELIRRGLLKAYAETIDPTVQICGNIEGAPPMPSPSKSIPELHSWNDVKKAMRQIYVAKDRADWLRKSVLPLVRQEAERDAEPIYKFGNRFITPSGLVYLLAQVSESEAALVNHYSGSTWSGYKSVCITTDGCISQEDFDKLADGVHFKLYKTRGEIE